MDVIEVSVTQEHINRAIEQVDEDPCEYCVVAQAIRDLFPDSKFWVAFSILEIDGVLYDIPIEAEEKIRTFMDKRQIDPFNFVATRSEKC